MPHVNTCTHCGTPHTHINTSCSHCGNTPHTSTFDMQCEPPFIAGKTVRYKIKCDELSELSDLGINKGDTIDYALERFGILIRDLGYIETPQIIEYPQLDSHEKIIKFLFLKLDEQQTQISMLQSTLNSLNVI